MVSAAHLTQFTCLPTSSNPNAAAAAKPNETPLIRNNRGSDVLLANALSMAAGNSHRPKQS
ncbi:MAG: hypothetical protein ACJAYX_003559 [Planctomycetota bacterium]|jgi:hypothetical protein